MAATAWRNINRTRDHRWAQPRMSAYIDGELSVRQERRLVQHQGLCPECRRMARTLRVLLEILAELRKLPQGQASAAKRATERVEVRIGEWL